MDDNTNWDLEKDIDPAKIMDLITAKPFVVSEEDHLVSFSVRIPVMMIRHIEVIQSKTRGHYQTGSDIARDAFYRGLRAIEMSIKMDSVVGSELGIYELISSFESSRRAADLFERFEVGLKEYVSSKEHEKAMKVLETFITQVHNHPDDFLRGLVFTQLSESKIATKILSKCKREIKVIFQKELDDKEKRGKE